MASTIEIVNSALTKLGESRIMDLSDDVKPAREMNAIYELRKRFLLRAYLWSFSMKRVSLSALSAAADWGYLFQYQLPTDCLRVVQVGDVWDVPGLADYINGPDTELYRIEGRTIQTDLAAPLSIRYVRDVTDPNQFDVCFTEALSDDLALTACEALTQSNTKKEYLAKSKQENLLLAVRANAIELPPQNIPDSSWVLSRL